MTQRTFISTQLDMLDDNRCDVSSGVIGGQQLMISQGQNRKVYDSSSSFCAGPPPPLSSNQQQLWSSPHQIHRQGVPGMACLSFSQPNNPCPPPWAPCVPSVYNPPPPPAPQLMKIPYRTPQSVCIDFGRFGMEAMAFQQNCIQQRRCFTYDEQVGTNDQTIFPKRDTCCFGVRSATLNAEQKDQLFHGIDESESKAKLKDRACDTGSDKKRYICFPKPDPNKFGSAKTLVIGKRKVKCCKEYDRVDKADVEADAKAYSCCNCLDRWKKENANTRPSCSKKKPEPIVEKQNESRISLSGNILETNGLPTTTRPLESNGLPATINGKQTQSIKLSTTTEEKQTQIDSNELPATKKDELIQSNGLSTTRENKQTQSNSEVFTTTEEKQTQSELNGLPESETSSRVTIVDRFIQRKLRLIKFQRYFQSNFEDFLSHLDYVISFLTRLIELEKSEDEKESMDGSQNDSIEFEVDQKENNGMAEQRQNEPKTSPIRKTESNRTKLQFDDKKTDSKPYLKSANENSLDYYSTRPPENESKKRDESTETDVRSCSCGPLCRFGGIFSNLYANTVERVGKFFDYITNRRCPCLPIGQPFYENPSIITNGRHTDCYHSRIKRYSSNFVDQFAQEEWARTEFVEGLVTINIEICFIRAVTSFTMSKKWFI